MAKPFVKWAGGKAKLVPAVAAAIAGPPRRYIEPFLGGGAMFFGLEGQGLAPAPIVNDLNAGLMEAYATVRDDVEPLIERLEGLGAAYLGGGPGHRAAFYYRMREERPATALDRAARLVFLNRTCFNGLYRVNRRGEFNVPHGDYKRPRICDAAGLREAAVALRGADLRCEDFEPLCDWAAEGDLLYLDPPYQPLTRTSSFTSYTEAAFGRAEQERLAAAARRAASRGALVLVSNSDHPFVRQLYEGFSIAEVSMSRAINSKGSARQPIAELLISSAPLPAAPRPALAGRSSAAAG